MAKKKKEDSKGDSSDLEDYIKNYVSPGFDQAYKKTSDWLEEEHQVTLIQDKIRPNFMKIYEHVKGEIDKRFNKTDIVAKSKEKVTDVLLAYLEGFFKRVVPAEYKILMKGAADLKGEERYRYFAHHYDTKFGMRPDHNGSMSKKLEEIMTDDKLTASALIDQFYLMATSENPHAPGEGLKYLNVLNSKIINSLMSPHGLKYHEKIRQTYEKRAGPKWELKGTNLTEFYKLDAGELAGYHGHLYSEKGKKGLDEEMLTKLGYRHKKSKK